MATSTGVEVIGKVVQVSGPAVDCEYPEGQIPVIHTAIRIISEGFDVPEADLGIIVASSSSPRQRIQSIGRVLRRVRDASGEEKSSRICRSIPY